MGDQTNIEWADATWNPIVGCSIVSPGCTNCYAMKQAARIELMHKGRHALHAEDDGVNANATPTPYAGLTQSSKAGAVWTGKVAMARDDTLTLPLRWKRGRRIFVNSMGDLFHESVPDAWIDRVFAVMALAPQHTFQILTKRAGRMREYLERIDREFHGDPDNLNESFGEHCVQLSGDPCAAGWFEDHVDWPLANCWLGVSAEDQPRADERIPDLLATPAAVRFVSAEPLLGGINFRELATGERTSIDALTGFQTARSLTVGEVGSIEASIKTIPPFPIPAARLGLDWIIAGGESGPGARPMHPDWARSICDQCAAAGVPFFFKQWGEWAPGEIAGPNDRSIDAATWCGDRWSVERVGKAREDAHIDDEPDLFRVGKAKAGRLLDGVLHNVFPEPRA